MRFSTESWRRVRKIGTRRSENYLLPAPSKRKMPPWIANPLIDDLDDQVSLNPRTNYQPAPGVLAQDQRTVIST